MRSRSLTFLAIFVVIIAGLAITGYFMDKAPVAPVQTAPEATSTVSDVIPAQLPVPNLTPTTADIPLPATSTLDTSSWQTYSDKSAGFSLAYPSDLMSSSDSGSLTLIFPKNSYFHWPLLDDVKITVSAASACPKIESAGFPGSAAPVDFFLNGYSFRRTIGNDVAAGNRYQEIAYDATIGSICYHIDFLDHGANGAGLYVDDASLIKKYDAAHDADLRSAISIFNAMIGSFRVLAQKP